jgi:hypothetical protein
LERKFTGQDGGAAHQYFGRKWIARAKHLTGG